MMTISNRIKLGYWLRKHPSLLPIAQSINRIVYNVTGSSHVLPNFLIIGSARSGTTSLYEYLTKHPSIIPGVGKEVYFFDKKFSKGINWYKSFFPTKLNMSRAENKLKSKCLTGEATPRYLHYPHAPKRIFSILPHVKLIVLLRNPIDRAYSHYQMEVDSGHEKLSFEDAISNEEERITSHMKKMENDENFYSVNFYRKSYLTRGIYVDQLKRWFKYFPREKFLILKSEDLYSNPSNTYQQVLDFLGLSNYELTSFKAHRMRDYSPISSQTREKLTKYFEPYNEQLYELLDRNYDWK
jgi:hypothetical protein